jgi:hypothetical protein|tara:strand:+ start:4450 stop:4818 length:369 start_codon:yes stop_codon:yes gene_type:complete
MGVSTRASVTEIGGILVSADNLDSDGAANVTGESSGSIYVIDIDNTKNTADVYLKVKDHATSVGSGQTPDWMFKGKAGVVSSYVFNTGIAYSAGVSIWCTPTAVVADTTDPTLSVRVDMVAS